MRSTIAFLTGMIAVTISAIWASAATAETLKVAVAQRGFWNSSFVEFALQQGFFKQEGLDIEILYTEGGASTLTAGHRRLARHRHDQRHARRHRRLRQGHAGEDHLGGSDRRPRRVLVCAAGERHQVDQGHQRQDGRVLLARLVDQSHHPAAHQPGEGDAEARADRRPAGNADAGDDAARSTSAGRCRRSC